MWRMRMKHFYSTIEMKAGKHMELGIEFCDCSCNEAA